jgi:hypothetical protein
LKEKEEEEEEEEECYYVRRWKALHFHLHMKYFNCGINVESSSNWMSLHYKKIDD